MRLSARSPIRPIRGLASGTSWWARRCEARQAAVISDEVLAACTPEQADRAVRSLLSAEVHVILAVRDFATLLPAEWQETVKTLGTAGWEEWLGTVIDVESVAADRRLSRFWSFHDTLASLDMWSRHIPPDQVHVITVPRQGRSRRALDAVRVCARCRSRRASS